MAEFRTLRAGVFLPPFHPNDEDPTLDIFESSTVAFEQSKVFRKADAIERLGKLLTVVVVLYGLVLGGAYVFHIWQLGQQIPK